MNKEEKMKTAALYGKSGTGKSHRAAEIIRKKNIEAIIDDGLLIMNNKVLAGKSAKKEKTKIESCKRALFFDENHAKSVREAIEKSGIKSILVLGTSAKMVDRISEILEIAPVSEYINIEDIQTKEELETARIMRTEQGKHIIPVTTVEIKKDFSGYFLHPIRTLKYNYGKKEILSDKTVIRPTYSYLGEYFVSDNVIAQIIRHGALCEKGVKKVTSITVESTPDGVFTKFSLSVAYGVNIPKLCDAVIKRVTADIDKMTALNVSRVEAAVKEIVVE